MMKPVKYRQIINNRYVLMRLMRYLLAFIVVVILLIISAGLGVKTVQLNKQLSNVQAGVYRSEDEMINGGKRFIDYLFSLNAASIEHDQYRAVAMIIDQVRKQEHIRYLKSNDIIRKVKSRHVRSEIDWNRAKVEVLDNNIDAFVVSYKTYLVVNYEQASPIHLILTLTPVKKTDSNTDGVGIINWRDVAKTPLLED